MQISPIETQFLKLKLDQINQERKWVQEIQKRFLEDVALAIQSDLSRYQIAPITAQLSINPLHYMPELTH